MPPIKGPKYGGRMLLPLSLERVPPSAEGCSGTDRYYLKKKPFKVNRTLVQPHDFLPVHSNGRKKLII